MSLTEAAAGQHKYTDFPTEPLRPVSLVQMYPSTFRFLKIDSVDVAIVSRRDQVAARAIFGRPDPARALPLMDLSNQVSFAGYRGGYSPDNLTRLVRICTPGPDYNSALIVEGTGRSQWVLTEAQVQLLSRTAVPTATQNGQGESDFHQRVIGNMPLAKFWAFKIVQDSGYRANGYMDFDDVAQDAMVGLVEAAGRFKGETGEFSTYASRRIRGEIFDAMRRGSFVPRSAVRRMLLIQEQTLNFMASHDNRAPSEAELLQATGLNAQQLHDSLRTGAIKMISLYAPNSDNEGGDPLADSIPAQVTDPATALEAKEILKHLGEALNHLDDRDREVLSLYYEQELTFREIANIMQLSESRVCQLCSRAIRRLGGFFNSIH